MRCDGITMVTRRTGCDVTSKTGVTIVTRCASCDVSWSVLHAVEAAQSSLAVRTTVHDVLAARNTAGNAADKPRDENEQPN
jgi:hypothetical protein